MSFLFKRFDPYLEAPLLYAPPPFDSDLLAALLPNPSSFLFDPFGPPIALLDADLVASLSDRVDALEMRLLHRDRGSSWARGIEGGGCGGGGGRRWKWAAEIRSPWMGEEEELDRRYRWEAAAMGARGEVKWTEEVEVEGNGFYAAPVKRTYTYEVSTVKEKEKGKGKVKEKKKKKKACGARAVEIEEEEEEEETNPETFAIRKAFAKSYIKGKRKELSLQDAAKLIQLNFRAHLARRSQALRCLRDLAIAKAKLKAIRALFCNFSYRRRIAHDAEERQRFLEKIVVLLLTVDALEGPDYMVRAAKKSMIKELEGMVEVVDPQPAGKQNALRRRKFDLPNGQLTNEMISSVEEVMRATQSGI